jgi:son of sevenless
MHQIMSREQNYKNARAYLHRVDPPCIPYLGVYLTDLTFIEDGNPDIIPDTGYINFVKRQKVSQVISEIQQYQNTPYCLRPVKEIADYLLAVVALDENECYKVSLEREERTPAAGTAAAKRPQRSGTRPVCRSSSRSCCSCCCCCCCCC